MDASDLAEIRSLGSLLYTPEDVARIMGIDEAEIELPGALHDAYWAGYYETDIARRKSIVDLAKRGSSPAQAELGKILEQSEMRRRYA